MGNWINDDCLGGVSKSVPMYRNERCLYKKRNCLCVLLHTSTHTFRRSKCNPLNNHS